MREDTSMLQRCHKAIALKLKIGDIKILPRHCEAHGAEAIHAMPKLIC